MRWSGRWWSWEDGEDANGSLGGLASLVGTMSSSCFSQCDDFNSCRCDACIRMRDTYMTERGTVCRTCNCAAPLSWLMAVADLKRIEAARLLGSYAPRSVFAVLGQDGISRSRLPTQPRRPAQMEEKYLPQQELGKKMLVPVCSFSEKLKVGEEGQEGRNWRMFGPTSPTPTVADWSCLAGTCLSQKS